jgi:flagellar basal body-associated protein FliL
MNKFIYLIIIAVIVIVAAGGAYWYFFKTQPEQIACTMEAKLCPDGSYVGRTGPKCEFTPCSTTGIR